jgi:hypothetical protein
MPHTTFVAFSSADQFVSDVIGAACKGGVLAGSDLHLMEP